MQVLLVADVLEPAEQQRLRVLAAGRVAGALLEIVDAASELVQSGDRALRQRLDQRLGEEGLEQARFPARREAAERGQRLVADAALRAGRGTQERRVVVGIDDQSQPGAEVADLGAVEEALPARNLVRNRRLAQRLLEDARLMVGAIEDREVAERRAARAQRLDPGDRALGLVDLVVALDQRDRIAGAEVAPELLLVELGVVADDGVGRGQDAAGRAIVLLERDDPQLRVVGRQTLQVLDRRAAPAVDALVVVADRGEVGRARRRAASAARTGRRWCPGTRRPGCSAGARARRRAPRHRARAAWPAGRSGRRSRPPGTPRAAPRSVPSRARRRARRRRRDRRSHPRARRPRRRRQRGRGSSRRRSPIASVAPARCRSFPRRPSARRGRRRCRGC